MEKTLDNTSVENAKTKISDLEIWGDGDAFKLICKASSKKEGWMKSTKAMQIDGVGCVVQVTTQQAIPSGYSPIKRNESGDLEVMKIDPNPEPCGNRYDYTKEVINYVISEAVTFVPGVKIHEEKDSEQKVTSRKLIAL